jgi:lactoylglutathione lyase
MRGLEIENMRVTHIDHIGVRVKDADRSLAFYALLGFKLIIKAENEPIYVIRSDDGAELNLVVNADRPLDENILMDVEEKHAGITHVALGIDAVEPAIEALSALGLSPTEGPLRLGPGTSVFYRDPDRNVIELRAEDQ